MTNFAILEKSGILDCLWPNVQPVTEKFYALLKARDVTVLDAIARSEKLLYTEEKSRTRRAVEAAEGRTLQNSSTTRK